ncbi:Lysozyme, partial [Frankliniella occidentalis]
AARATRYPGEGCGRRGRRLGIRRRGRAQVLQSARTAEGLKRITPHDLTMVPAWLGGLGLLALLALRAPGVEAHVYEACELAKQLKSPYGFPLSQIPTFVCIAYYESRFNTSAVSKPNRDKSIDYGIFQINSRWWCDRGPKLGCGVTCQTLLTDMDQVAKWRRIQSMDNIQIL